MKKQFTTEQAIKFYESKEWDSWTDEQIVRFQLFQDKLCLPFDKFHKAMEIVLGRPVWTHEFAYKDNLTKEYLGCCDAPTMEEIINLIPAEKRINIGI